MQFIRAIIPVVFFTVAGCSEWSLVHDAGGPACRKVAPEPGQYNLYEAKNPIPRQCAMLLKGDPIGFERDHDGQLLALAGTDAIPVVEGKCQWVHPWNVRNGEDHLKLDPTATETTIAWAGSAVYWFLRIYSIFGGPRGS